MSEQEINAELEAGDQSGFEEVMDEQDIHPVSEPVQLSAAIIDQAYKELKAALREQMAVDLKECDHDPLDLYETDIEKDLHKLDVAVEYRIKLARAEVDRVTALANWLQIEAIYKTIGG